MKMCTKYVIDRPARDTLENIFVHIHDKNHSSCRMTYPKRWDLWRLDHILVLNDLVNDSVGQGLLRGHVEISIGVET